MFIGRFNSDKLYYLLGYRPREIVYMFSEESESNRDIALVTMREGKIKLNELVGGDILTLNFPNQEPSEAKYLSR